MIWLKKIENDYYYKKFIFFNSKFLLKFWVKIRDIINYLNNKLLIQIVKKQFIFNKI